MDISNSKETMPYCLDVYRSIRVVFYRHELSPKFDCCFHLSNRTLYSRDTKIETYCTEYDYLTVLFNIDICCRD